MPPDGGRGDWLKVEAGLVPECQLVAWLLVRQEVGQWLGPGPVLNACECPLPILKV